MEFIGDLIALVTLTVASLALGGVMAGASWLVFHGRSRPKTLILMTGAIPVLSFYYIIAAAILFQLFVPNPPGILGDINEPIPHGYSLTGIGKMPEYSFFESTPPMAHQPPLRGGVRRLDLGNL